jgi:hypothetical protein
VAGVDVNDNNLERQEAARVMDCFSICLFVERSNISVGNLI